MIKPSDQAAMTTPSRRTSGRNLSRNRLTIRQLVGDDLCNSLVLIRMPAGWRERLHEVAGSRQLTLNTLCLEAFWAILNQEPEHARECEDAKQEHAKSGQ